MTLKDVSILLIDDEPTDIRSVQDAFSHNNIRNPLFVANTASEALDMLRGVGREKISPRPRIILLDLDLPGMSGIEFLKAIRNDAEFKASSVFVFTGSEKESDRLEAFQFNVAGFIKKPFQSADFFETMARLGKFWRLCEFV